MHVCRSKVYPSTKEKMVSRRGLNTWLSHSALHLGSVSRSRGAPHTSLNPTGALTWPLGFVTPSSEATRTRTNKRGAQMGNRGKTVSEPGIDAPRLILLLTDSRDSLYILFKPEYLGLPASSSPFWNTELIRRARQLCGQPLRASADRPPTVPPAHEQIYKLKQRSKRSYLNMDPAQKNGTKQ